MTPEQKFKDAGINGKQYRSAPFWSWNDDLDPEELRRQVRTMCDSGMGGFFMHARNGLLTPYLSEEYMACHEACIDEARKLGMGAWLYDEDCWPSGSAGGIMPARGPEFQSKKLVCESRKGGEDAGDNILACYKAQLDGEKVIDAALIGKDTIKGAGSDENFLVVRLVYDGYIDNLREEAVASFIDSTFDLFSKLFKPDFGGVIPGIFTDEPNYHLVPWTQDFADEFKARRGYDVTNKLVSVFHAVGDWRKVRHDYYQTAMELYVQAFSKQIGDWCEKKDLKLTGHQLCEDTLSSQTHVIGAAMPHYEYMQYPGIDHLCRGIVDPIIMRQVGSVANQMGKERVLSETFGCSGWNMSFEDQKWIAEWQYVQGVNLMCQHLLLYSLRGCRKRDYPPSIFYQQPWWPEYNAFEDHFARLAAALTSGKNVADALVIHPIGSAWATFEPVENFWHPDDPYNISFAALSQNLNGCHVGYDYGDESMMARHARISDGKIHVGQAEYKLVILPPMLTIQQSTLNILSEWIAAGGKVVVVDAAPTMVDAIVSDEPAKVLAGQPIVPNEFDAIKEAIFSLIPPRINVTDHEGVVAQKIVVQQRDLDGKQLFFLANSDNQTGTDAVISLSGEGLVEEWDLDTGEIKAIPCQVNDGVTRIDLPFAPAGSRLISIDPSKAPVIGWPEIWRTVSETELDGAWSIARQDPNAITLDFCQYKIADGEWSAPAPTIWLEAKLSQIREETPLSLRFSFKADFRKQIPEDITLILEDPQQFDIAVNDRKVEYVDSGWWTDHSFKKIPIADYVRQGDNVIELKLSYLGLAGRKERTARLDLPKYLGRAYTNPPADVADPIILPFKGEVADLQRQVNELKYGSEIESIYIIGSFSVNRDGGGFVLSDAVNQVDASDMVEQGYPFFRGSVSVSKTVKIAKKPDERVVLSLGDKVGAIVTKIRVNGKDGGRLVWRPLQADITDLVVDGPNAIEIEFINSCHNLLGPHHATAGELTAVGPHCFGSYAGYAGMEVELDLPWWAPKPEEDLKGWKDEYTLVPLGFVSAPKLLTQELLAPTASPLL